MHDPFSSFGRPTLGFWVYSQVKKVIVTQCPCLSLQGPLRVEPFDFDRYPDYLGVS